MAKKLFIGVGHGGSDPGAVSGTFRESDLNLSIATACYNYLKNYDVEIMLSRDKDEDDPLSQVIVECNNFAPDFALDIHNNAGGGDGFEAYYKVANPFSKEVASFIEAEVIKIGQNSRGLKTKLQSDGRDWFGFLREITAPSILVECAFVDNVTDRVIIDSPEKLVTMGEAIAKGLVLALGYEKSDLYDDEDIYDDDETNKYYKVQVGAFLQKTNAQALLVRLQQAGFSGYIKYE